MIKVLKAPSIPSAEVSLSKPRTSFPRGGGLQMTVKHFENVNIGTNSVSSSCTFEVKIWGGHDPRAIGCSRIQVLRAEVRPFHTWWWMQTLSYSLAFLKKTIHCILIKFKFRKWLFSFSRSSHAEATSSGAVTQSGEDSGNENQQKSVVSFFIFMI